MTAVIHLTLSNEQYAELNELRYEYEKHGFKGNTEDFVKFILQAYGMISYAED